MDNKSFFKVMKILIGIGLLAVVIFVAFLKTAEKGFYPDEKKPAQKAIATIQQAPAKQNEKDKKVLQEKKPAAKKEAVKAVAAVVKKTSAKPAQQLFPAEKILTISAFEYCENHGKSIKDYEIVGIHGRGNYLFDRKDLLSGSAKWWWTSDTLSNLFILRIPPNTEVVVGLEYSSGDRGDDVANGVALIPKPKIKKQSAIKPARKK